MPYVVSTHGATSPQNLGRYRVRKAAYGRLVEHRLVGGAQALLASTPVEAQELRRWHPDPPPIRVLANVADPSLLEAPAWTPPTGPAPAPVVSLGRFDVRHKGLDRMSTVAKRLPTVRFDVHGARCGNEPELLDQLIAEKPGNLRLLDAVHGQAKADALRESEAFILLSRWEGLSVALLEALALGVPCVVSPEVAATLGPDAPVFVQRTDASTQGRALAAFLSDDDARRTMGARGRAWAQLHASPAAVGAASIQCYEEALLRHQGGRPALPTSA